MIYRTEVINDQVITMPSIWRAGYSRSTGMMGQLEIGGCPLMQCGIVSPPSIHLAVISTLDD
jgi:hypothetical protein